MEYLINLIDSYNEFMSSHIESDFISGAVTVWLLTFISYISVKLPNYIKTQIFKHLTTVVTIDSTHVSFHKLMGYLGKHDTVKNSRYLQILNGTWGQSKAQLSIGEGNQLIYMLNVLCVINLRKINLMDKIAFELRIVTLGRNLKVADKIMDIVKTKDVKDGHIKCFEKVDGALKIYQQPKEKLNTVVLTDTVENEINKVKTFLENEDFYNENGIPYHLGILLHGEPGTGKTKFVRVLAGIIGYEVHIIKTVVELSSIPKRDKIVIVIEEADAILPKRKTGEEAGDALSNKLDKDVSEALTELDGIVQSHGRIIIMTTNYPDKLDPAIKRPGRMDIKIELKYITIGEFKKFIKLYYPDENIELDKSVEVKEKMTGANIQLTFRNMVTVEEFIYFNTNASSYSVKEHKNSVSNNIVSYKVFNTLTDKKLKNLDNNKDSNLQHSTYC